eukprot:NODE_493_length_2182_cov_30.227848_g453_i0.p1 GENE.NODE_493_length_2182_cov_30.227848_g453_i0~~NODE_493_length_2182_cov_30.227848_g453_i0.p1  ORF type:complete len:672 (+),score=119.84 NODE_493_length_2182_cov_30.227848_g453_i0:137-2152(+)
MLEPVAASAHPSPVALSGSYGSDYVLPQPQPQPQPPSASGYSLQVVLPDVTVVEHPLLLGKTLIGRVAPPNDEACIVIQHLSISKQHAHFDLQSGSCFLIDLGSMNGTYMKNGMRKLERGTRYEIKHGASVMFGQVPCVFIATADARDIGTQCTHEDLLPTTLLPDVEEGVTATSQRTLQPSQDLLDAGAKKCTQDVAHSKHREPEAASVSRDNSGHGSEVSLADARREAVECLGGWTYESQRDDGLIKGCAEFCMLPVDAEPFLAPENTGLEQSAVPSAQPPDPNAAKTHAEANPLGVPSHKASVDMAAGKAASVGNISTNDVAHALASTPAVSCPAVRAELSNTGLAGDASTAVAPVQATPQGNVQPAAMQDGSQEQIRRVASALQAMHEGEGAAFQREPDASVGKKRKESPEESDSTYPARAKRPKPKPKPKAKGKSTAKRAVGPTHPAESAAASREVSPKKVRFHSDEEHSVKVCFTGTSGAARTKAQNTVTRLGGVVVDDVLASTHLVVMNPTLTRTAKLLSAVASGKWVLAASWLDASRQAASFVKEGDHWLHDGAAEEKWLFHLEQSVLTARGRLLFAGAEFFITPSVPGKEVIAAVVVAAGGQVQKHLNKDCYVITCEGDRYLYHSYIREEKALKSRIRTAEFVFRSVLQQKLSNTSDCLLLN